MAFFRQELAIDLGTANTVIFKDDKVVLDEPSIIAVETKTEKLVATTAAECKREVDTIAAEAKLKVAEIGVQRSELMAKITSLKGETEANVRFLTANESALGEAMLAKALGGGQYLAYMKAVEALNPKITTNVIYAGDGTLWTDLEKAALPLPTKPAQNRIQQAQPQQLRK